MCYAPGLEQQRAEVGGLSGSGLLAGDARYSLRLEASGRVIVTAMTQIQSALA